MMQRRACGNSGLELPVLGIGCWAYGGSSGDYWGAQNQKDVTDVMHCAVDLGANYFDTAEGYNAGQSETALGAAMRDMPREKVLIGSKVSPPNCYPDTLVEHCDASLKRLGTDYIDLYMIHWPLHSHAMKYFTNDQSVINNPPAQLEAFETLVKLRDSGKIRYFGVSNFSRKRLQQFPSLEPVAVNQVAYNLMSRAAELEIMPYCQQQGIGIIGYSALMQGVLTGAYRSLDNIPPNRRRTRHFDAARTAVCRHGESGCEKQLMQALSAVRSIAEDCGIPMRDLAIRWTLAHPALTCTLAGCRNVQQLEQNISHVNEPLTVDVVAALNVATQPVMDALGNHFDYYESAENDRT